MTLTNASPMAAKAAGASPMRSKSVRVTSLDAVVICAILVAGLAHLGSPFSGDQFLYLVGAKKIAHHGVIYRDFWDLKQPLIFCLYAAAGEMFGFTEAGIHLFETLYQTIFAAILIAVFRARLRYLWAASVVPLLAVGPYYAFATNEVLTSVETFAGLPIFAAALYAADAFAAGSVASWRAVAAGVAGALVAALKLAFFPLVVALWVAALMLSRALGPRGKLAIVAFLALGCAVPLTLFVVYFGSAGVLDVAFRTAFVDPPAVFSHVAAAYRDPFWSEARTFGRATWPLALLAAIGAISAWRRADVLPIQMIVWVIGGCMLIAVQIWSYYYKFFIVIVPLGVLATVGIETSWAAAGGRGIWAKTVFASAMLVMTGASLQAALRVQAAWHLSARDNQLAAASSRSFLDRAGTHAGDIYVFGDPETYYFSQRDQAVSINGWSPQLLLPAQWHELRDEMALAAPPYIFIQSHYAPIVHDVPEMATFLSRSYRAVFLARDGIWYERR